VIAVGASFQVHHAHVPFPQVQRVANIEKRLLAVQLQLVEGLGLHLASEAVELLAMNTDDEAKIAPPTQNGAEGIVEIQELHVIGERDQADHHGAHLAKNGP